MKPLGIILLLVFQAAQTPAPSTPVCCDLNGDGLVNVADVQIVMNGALGLPVPAAVMCVEVVEVLAGPPWTLSQVPASFSTPLLDLNGLIQKPGRDYQINTQTITFTASDLGDSPEVQVRYWSRQ